MNTVNIRHQKSTTGIGSTTDRAVGSILVMDDDEMIRVMAAVLLERLGYSATTCVNGEEAIELYRNARKSGTPFLTGIIDLMILGGMGGKDAAKHILQIDPSARLIVSSGNPFDPVVANHRSYGFHASLPKPYTKSIMAEVLATIISQ